MKSKFSTVMIILLILTGLSLLLYPTVSDYLKSVAQSNAISDYRHIVEELEPESYDEILAQAEVYNADLARREYILLPFSDEDKLDYESQVRLPGTDVMGYVVIPKIGISLPIYHGTSDAVLQNGVGHLEGSSLPIGGRGTHTVLAGHRGLVSAKLFTDLDQLELGDVFQIRVLGEVLFYEVDEIESVLPTDSGVLQIDREGDFCTLLTCTPYGINSHRLLVRGSRVPAPETASGGADFEEVPLKNGRIFGLKAEIVFAVAAVLLALLVVFTVLAVRRGAKCRGQKEAQNESGEGKAT